MSFSVNLLIIFNSFSLILVDKDFNELERDSRLSYDLGLRIEPAPFRP